MGIAITLLITSIVLPLCISLISRDAYVCLPRLQKYLLKIAAKVLPKHQQADAIEQWQADINDLLPSEIVRTWVAFDIIRGALVIRYEVSSNFFWKLRYVFHTGRKLEKMAANIKRQGNIILDAAARKPDCLDAKCRAKEIAGVMDEVDERIADVRKCQSELIDGLKGRTARAMCFIARHI